MAERRARPGPRRGRAAYDPAGGARCRSGCADLAATSAEFAPLDVVALLIGDNMASTAVGPIEVFSAAGVLWQALHDEAIAPRFNVTTASIDGQPVTTSYALRIEPQCSIDEVGHADLVIVPASGLNLDEQIRRHRPLLPWLRDRYADGAWLAGICSGVAYLAQAGLLDGRRATTHWALVERYRERYPAVDWVSDVFITEDRRVLCSGGVYAAIDLSLYLVEKFCGHETALQCARTLLVDMPRAHQSGYAILPLSRPHGDARIHDIEEYIATHCAESLTIERLAERARMSARTFQRRFKSATGRLPGAYLQAQRIAIARALLEDSNRSVQQVSQAIGYNDLAFFRKVFRRETGMTPGEYRVRFTGIPVSHAAL
jgi:transcriptional regulator GlxA family with amidase domain